VRSSRRLPALIGATALVTAALAGCTAVPGSGCDPVYSSGASSSIVTATGSHGSAPKVDFPTPLVTKKSQVSVVEAGDGALVEDGDQVDVALSIYFGADGQDIAGQVQKGRLAAGIDAAAISEALVCTHVGDRISLVTTTAEAYGKGGGAQANLKDSDTLVMVIDVLASYLGKANGFNQLPQDGMPNVSTEVDGTPGVGVSLQVPPTSTRSSVIKAGDGAKIKAGDAVVSSYSIFTWAAGDQPVFVKGTWDNHNTSTDVLDDKTTLPPGWVKAITGKRVGSQILIVLVPGDDSYTADNAPADPNATYIVVVDLLGIQK
jgi:peptidylprolyl isomerase